jgi:DNA-binding transcriptional MerR regulator
MESDLDNRHDGPPPGGDESSSLTIGEVARRTGISVPTLRVWEARYGVPTPDRRVSGHRRYSESDCRLLQRIKSERSSGATMTASIDRALRAIRDAETSVFGGVVHRHPALAILRLPRTFMLAMSRAIEQQAGIHAADAVLVGCFQRQRAWARAADRWRALAKSARLAMVFADFPCVGRDGAAWQVPIPAGAAAMREWAVIVDSPVWAVCLVAREREEVRSPGVSNWFDAVWSMDPVVAHDAIQLACRLGAGADDALGAACRRAVGIATAPSREGFGVATELTNSILTNLLLAATRTKTEAFTASSRVSRNE